MAAVEAGGMTHAGLLSESPGSAGKLDPLEFLEAWRIPGGCAFRSVLPSRRTV
jgi:hypothetical protein